jgi:DNA-binding IclR family transcriptional regulator
MSTPRVIIPGQNRQALRDELNRVVRTGWCCGEWRRKCRRVNNVALVNFEVKVDVRASIAIATLMETMDSLQEDMPWREDLKEAEDALILLANNMVVVSGDRITGRFKAERNG